MILAGMGASPVRFVCTDETRNIRGLQVFKAFSSEVDTGSRKENASKKACRLCISLTAASVIAGVPTRPLLWSKS
jgi:hypothetical protein